MDYELLFHRLDKHKIYQEKNKINYIYVSAYGCMKTFNT